MFKENVNQGALAILQQLTFWFLSGIPSNHHKTLELILTRRIGTEPC